MKSGTTLGPYQIVAAIGSGGMGEVYRARDPRLGRDVAIKVLPAAFSAEPDRLRRFEQEARAVAALNHPNILALYDLGTHDGQPYVVSELLEGQTLRDALEGGALPIKKAIDYAVQIANGLAAAHERGIVHRDLKPENLFITHDGRVKILDFGLAKVTEAQPAFTGVSASPTTPPAGTQPGLVLGTAGYMSPEQVRGLPADHRADLFAFGAVLYEMLSGQRAFRGDTTADTMTAILKEAPSDLADAQRPIPPALVRIVDRCLEKMPAARFQSAGDLAFALAGLATQSESVAALPTRIARPYARSAWILSAIVAITSIVAGTMTIHLWAGDRKPSSFLQTPFNESAGRFSPDGRWLAYTSNESEQTEVYVASFPGPGGKWRVSTGGGNWPRWRKDGREIFFLTPNNTLMAAAVNGQGSSFEVGVVHALFETHPRFENYLGSASGYSYDVSVDGQRVLVNTRVGDATSTPITLVINWAALLKP